MSVFVLVAAIVFAAVDLWWIAVPMLFAGCVFARLEVLDRRDERMIHRLRAQLCREQRRQLRICDRDAAGNRGRRYGA